MIRSQWKMSGVESNSSFLRFEGPVLFLHITVRKKSKDLELYLFWVEPRATQKDTWSSTIQATDEEPCKKAFHSNTRQSPHSASEDGRWRKAATSRKLRRYHQRAFEGEIRRSSKPRLRSFSTAHYEGFLCRWRLPCERFSDKFPLATHRRLTIILHLNQSKLNYPLLKDIHVIDPQKFPPPTSELLKQDKSK